MKDLISRQAAIGGKIPIQLSNGVEIYYDEAVPVDYLKHLSSADVVERKKGRWIDLWDRYRCSACNMEHSYEENYCPNCGAKMG